MFLHHNSLIIVLLSVWILQITSGCGRGSIKIQNNGYKDILIAVADGNPDNPALVERIKSAFSQASALLYSATKKRAYFEAITILVPSSWQGVYGRAGKESFDKSDIVVDKPETRVSQGNRPFVIKTTPCGETGYYMHLTVDFLTNDTVAQQFGPYDKILVHEWSHLRYGVYDEYQSDYPGAKHFYAAPNGEPEPIKCAASIQGSQYNAVTGATSCSSVGGLPESDCRFKEQIPAGETGYASLMYKVILDGVTEFCDNDATNTKTLHNREAPHSQNRFCGQRSVWEVLRGHEDFTNGTNPPREITNTTPSFTVVQHKAMRTVLVLDVSGSMRTIVGSSGSYMDALGQGCSNYISNIIPDDELLGVVWFNATGITIANLTIISNATTRTEMLQYIPRVPSGGTSIGGGINKALNMLKEHDPSDVGGTIIVVTDGVENTSPKIPDIIKRVIDDQVTAHTIAIGPNADSSLELLATSTGGQSFIYSGTVQSNAINEAFLAIGEFNTNPTDRSYVLQSDSQDLQGNGMISGNILIDNTLGRYTQFLFDYTAGDILPVVVSPTGKVYNSSDNVVEKDSTFGIYRFTIPQAEFQSGEWNYTVTSVTGSSIRVAVTVKSKSATVGEYPIVATVHWGKRSIETLDPSASNNVKQSIYASVSKGYSPVLNAVIVATVERINNRDSVSVTLLDNGAGADTEQGDGVYSAYFLQFNQGGRYGVKVKCDSNAATVTSSRRIIGLWAPATGSTGSEVSVDPFVRSASGGSFTLVPNIIAASGKFYLPGQITDLSVDTVNYDNQTVTLTWTAVGDQLDIGQASSYELRLGTSFTEMETNFGNQTLVTNSMLESNNSLWSPQAAGAVETYVIRAPSKGAVTYVFAIKAVDSVNRTASGPMSNIVTASLKSFSSSPQTSPLSTAVIIASIVAGGLAVAVLVITLVVAIVTARVPDKVNKNKANVKYSGYENQDRPYHNNAHSPRIISNPYAYNNMGYQAYGNRQNAYRY